MIGTKVSATLWRITYHYRQLAAESTAERHHTEQRFVLTADPAGGDLLEVARMVALGGRPQLAIDFVL